MYLKSTRFFFNLVSYQSQNPFSFTIINFEIIKGTFTGAVDFDQHNKNVILQFLVAADELELNKLIERIQEYLIENHEFLNDDPVGIFRQGRLLLKSISV